MEIRALTRAVEILNCVGSEPAGITLSGIVHAVGLSKATTYRFVQSMLTADFLRFDPESARFFLGPALLRLGRLAAPHEELRQIARPHMEVLRDRTGETVSLVAPIRAERMTIDVALSDHELRAAPEVGSVKPLYAGAAGKAMLAFFLEDEIEQILLGSKLKSIAPGSITHAAALRRELVRVSARGYAVSVEETVLGQAASAAPIFRNDGKVVASLNVSGPKVRLPRSALEKHGDLAAVTAAAISSKLGAGRRIHRQEFARRTPSMPACRT